MKKGLCDAFDAFAFCAALRSQWRVDGGAEVSRSSCSRSSTVLRGDPAAPDLTVSQDSGEINSCKNKRVDAVVRQNLELELISCLNEMHKKNHDQRV